MRAGQSRQLAVLLQMSAAPVSSRFAPCLEEQALLPSGRVATALSAPFQVELPAAASAAPLEKEVCPNPGALN